MHCPVSQPSNFSVSSNRRLPWNGLLLVVVSLAWLPICPLVQAVDPPPVGGYPNDNTAEGDNALFSLTTGKQNTAIGYQALVSNSSGSLNTATGARALFANQGSYNTANGALALQNNSLGRNNTAVGLQALGSNTRGSFNTATGSTALLLNTTGTNNTANGFQALFLNRTGTNNTASGTDALLRNTTGNLNTANGVNTLYTNNDGRQNTATGANALHSNTTGSFNTAEGVRALFSNITGDNNIALGNSAGSNLTTGSNNIDIGAIGAIGEADTIRIGSGNIQNRTFIAGIRGTITANANAVPVVVDLAGQLGTVSSSQRFKDQIMPMDSASEAIMGLKPVTFHYKSDKENTPQFGLIAEEVAKVNPNLVVRNEDGEVYTVRYEAVNAMLLNEFLKEHRKVEELEKQIETLIATVRKVSDQLKLNQSVATVATNH
jgi:hypothetical protein